MDLAYNEISQHKEHDAKASRTILCVDDEPNILNSLKRTLRKQPYKLLTAGSGAEAIEILEEHSIDLVVSDMRMPEMTGAELLSYVYLSYPNTMRILLTGYSEMESTVSAINEAKIHQYISKPWENQELLFSIDKALDQKILQDELNALTLLTQKQNEELKELNENLEAKVAERTQEISEASVLLKQTYDQLNDSYQNSISVFSNIIELREGELSGHGQNVAKLSEAIGKKVKLDVEQLSDLRSAALLHDIGKLGFSDELCKLPVINMNDKERGIYETHPCMGQASLLSISALDETGKIIRSHHEDFDGKGFPDALSKDKIPLGSRILAVTSDFDDLQQGLVTGDPCSTEQAIIYISSKSGTRYDPELVKIFLSIVRTQNFELTAPKEMKLNYHEIVPGMVLARNIKSDNGMLMLREGQVLYESIIERIHMFIDDTKSSKVIYITGESVLANTPASRLS